MSKVVSVIFPADFWIIDLTHAEIVIILAMLIYYKAPSRRVV